MAMNPLQALIQHAQALRAAGGGAPGGISAGGPPQGAGDPQGPDNASDLVQQASELIAKAVGVEKDPVERAGLAKVLALLHQFAATEQKQKDAAMGAGPAVQVLRRTAQ